MTGMKKLEFNSIKFKLYKAELLKKEIIKEINVLSKALTKACDHPVISLKYSDGCIEYMYNERCEGTPDSITCTKCDLSVVEDDRLFSELRKKLLKY